MADLLRIPPIVPTDFAEVVSVLTPMNAIYAVPEDIHKYTAYLGAQCKQIFLRLDDKYHLAQAGDFETIAREITALSGNDASVITVLGSIRAAGSTVDRETGLNIRDLLVRTWGLASHPLAPQKITTDEHPGIQINARQVVVENLQHNKKTGGGCLPGISARLTQPYCTFMTIILEQAMLKQKERYDSAASQLPGVHTITTTIVVPHVAPAAAATVSRKPTREEIDAEQEELEAAIIASLQPVAPRYMPTYEARAARTSVPHSDGSELDEDIKAQLQAAYGPDWSKYIK